MQKMQHIILLFTLLSTTVIAYPGNSVVKIFTAASTPNYKLPWLASGISNYSGSGVVIKDNQILTSAHVVSNGKFIEVKKENNPNKYFAKVKYISHQADLAILEVTDKSFFDDVKQLKLNDDIKARDKVTVLGYPVGGNMISTTSGIVSRIEYTSYVWSESYLLAIQIDAAINSGNSGGAVINTNNELVGIAMMTLSDTSNIGYIVPAIIINTFLEDIKDGTVDGFHEDSIIMQKAVNNSLRDFYELGTRTGVLIRDTGMEEKLLKVNDVVLTIDGKDIANNGTIESKYGRINFNMLFHQKQVGDTVELNILRDKKELTLEYTLKKVTPLINQEFDTEPRYIIYGGYTFTPLTKNYLEALYSDSTDVNLLFYEKKKTPNCQELVVSLDTIFPSQVNRGYNRASYVLLKVNDIKIKDFNHLVEILDGNQNEFTVLEFLEKEVVVLNTKEAKKGIEDVKKIYNLTSDRSKAKG